MEFVHLKMCVKSLVPIFRAWRNLLSRKTKKNKIKIYAWVGTNPIYYWEGFTQSVYLLN
jgi:hypothetical protein